MLKFRDYTPADGDLVASWVTDEWTLRVWSADSYAAWPVTGAQINGLYEQMTAKEPSFRAWMAEEEGIPVGHMVCYYADAEKTVVHFGFILINPDCRGRGIGSRMIRLVLDCAFGAMKAKTVKLMVLDCNERAHRCYENLGFRDVPDTTQVMDIQGKRWTRHRMEISRA